MNAILPRFAAATRCTASLLILTMLAGCTQSPVPNAATPVQANHTQSASEDTTPANTLEPTTRPTGNKVSVGDYGLYLRCVGEGSPTILIEPDIDQAGTNSNWGKVTRELGLTTRVCVYDRANLGRSDNVDGLRTSEDIAVDLANLLESAEIQPPYLLIADGMGSWHARVFAAYHADVVLGMVLINPMHDHYFERLLAMVPPEEDAEEEVIGLMRDWYSDPMGTSDTEEQIDYGASADQVRDSGTYGDLPIIILSWDPAIIRESPIPPHIDTVITQERQAMMSEHQNLSTNSEYRIVEGVEYTVQMENSQAVVDAVMTVIERAR